MLTALTYMIGIVLRKQLRPKLFDRDVRGAKSLDDHGVSNTVVNFLVVDGLERVVGSYVG